MSWGFKSRSNRSCCHSPKILPSRSEMLLAFTVQTAFRGIFLRVKVSSMGSMSSKKLVETPRIRGALGAHIEAAVEVLLVGAQDVETPVLGAGDHVVFALPHEAAA